MPLVFESDLHRYISKQDIRNLRRSQGRALHLPDGRGLQYMNRVQDVEINGDGIMDIIGAVGNFIKDNKDTINSAVDTVGKVASTTIGIVKGAEEIENIKALRKKAEAKKGDSLYLPESDKGDGISLSTPVVSSKRSDIEVAKRIAKGKGFKIINPS